MPPQTTLARRLADAGGVELTQDIFRFDEFATEEEVATAAWAGVTVTVGAASFPPASPALRASALRVAVAAAAAIFAALLFLELDLAGVCKTVMLSGGGMAMAFGSGGDVSSHPCRARATFEGAPLPP